VTGVDSKICNNDSVIFCNFRPDRAIQLSAVLTNPAYNPKPEEPVFQPTYRPSNLTFVAMMHYSEDVIGEVAFQKLNLDNVLGKVLETNGLKQLRISETEKYPHVTFFFDGGIEVPYVGKEEILVNSPHVATYDLQPEMSAYELTDKLVASIESGKYDVIIVNYPNPDMVGHSGMLEPTIKAVETVDECINRVAIAVEKAGGVCLITADHGNAEVVLNSDASPNTSHTTNPVNFLITDNSVSLKDDCALCDIAPTILHILNIEKPVEMTGTSIIKE